MTAEELAELRRQIHEVAAQAGFPDANSAEARARFDASCAPVLASSPILQSGEAYRDDVWAYIAASLVSPITWWRYGSSRDRWHGGVRNTFQRLWLRTRALDRGVDHVDRWGLVDALSEDALVAIIERTAVAAQRPLAVAIAEGWVRAAEQYGRGQMEAIMRQAIITLRLKNEVTALGLLPAEDLAVIVDLAFTRAAGASTESRPAKAAPSKTETSSPAAPTSPPPPRSWLRRAFTTGAR